MGLVGAAVGTKLCLRLLRTGRIPLPEDKRLVGVLGSAVLGFGAGYGAMSMVQWLRWRAIKWLLAYHGWMFNQKAKSTVVSALFLLFQYNQCKKIKSFMYKTFGG